MATEVIYADEHADFDAAVVALKAATNGTVDVSAAMICDIIKIGTSNWAYWVIYTA